MLNIVVAVLLADYVRSLKKPVRARYCKGLFTQVPFRDGTVYNVGTSEKFFFIQVVS